MQYSKTNKLISQSEEYENLKLSLPVDKYSEIDEKSVTKLTTLGKSIWLHECIGDIKIVRNQCYLVAFRGVNCRHGGRYKEYTPPRNIFPTGKVLLYERGLLSHPLLIFNCVRGKKEGKQVAYNIDNKGIYHKQSEEIYSNGEQLSINHFHETFYSVHPKLPIQKKELYIISKNEYVSHPYHTMYMSSQN